MKPVIRKYQFATIEEYFEYQKTKQTVGGSPWGEADRDTYAKMGQRHNKSGTTIFRIVARQADPSYALAKAISDETGVALDGFGMTDEQRNKARRDRKRRG